MRIEFHTTKFMLSHQRAPHGRGSWAFQICAIDDHDGEGGTHFSPSMTLAEARRWVKPIIESEAKQAMGRGVRIARVDVDILP